MLFRFEGSTHITASSIFVDLAISKPTSHKLPPISKDADVFYVNSAASAVGAASVQLLAICGFRSLSLKKVHWSCLVQLTSINLFGPVVLRVLLIRTAGIG